MEDKPCVWETDVTEIETSIHWIASALHNAAEGYLTLASHISKIAPYELPQIVAQIPPHLWMFLCLLEKHYQQMEKVK